MLPELRGTLERYCVLKWSTDKIHSCHVMLLFPIVNVTSNNSLTLPMVSQVVLWTAATSQVSWTSSSSEVTVSLLILHKCIIHILLTRRRLLQCVCICESVYKHTYS